jgi:type II secretory pathway component PulC
MLILHQKKFYKLIFVIVLFCSCIAYSGQDTPDSDFKKYTIIAERNIFSKYKTAARERENPVVQKKILSLYILRGVSLNGKTGLAFIEDEISGEHRRLKIGEDIVGCRIKDIKSDFIVYEKDGHEHTVKIGSELSRAESQISAPQKSVASLEKEVKTNDSAAQITGVNDDVLKKMMERRKSQVSK